LGWRSATRPTRPSRCTPIWTPPDEHLATRSLELFDENPFEPSRSLAETLQVSHSIVLKHLHEDLHCNSFYLPWVPHPLTRESREQRC
jgi:hypothetical protein